MMALAVRSGRGDIQAERPPAMQKPTPIQLVQLSLAAVLVLCGLLAVISWRIHSRQITRCEERVRRVINQELRRLKVDPVRRVDFIEASRLFGMPAEVTFENNLFRSDGIARHGVGRVSGVYYPLEDRVEMHFEVSGATPPAFDIARALSEAEEKPADKAPEKPTERPTYHGPGKPPPPTFGKPPPPIFGKPRTRP